MAGCSRFAPNRKLKTYVVNEKEDTRTPFLRGILTRSLLDAGLVFEEAFDLATVVRDDLVDVAEISTDDLRVSVYRLLEESGHLGAMEPYRLPLVAPARIQVVSSRNTESAFSRGKHERYLQASGLNADKAEQTTERIYDHLLAAGMASITSRQLGYLTYLCLVQEVSKKAARRYLVWFEFQKSEQPLALLICGTVGSGKSTIATEVAHLLDIVRIQSTDMLREVMRMLMPKKLLPVLHSSSFNAWKALPIEDIKDRDKDQLVADGYRSQADLLALPCEAVIHRAFEESVPIILEGVHAHPTLMERIQTDSGGIKVHVTLAVLKSKTLKSRLRGRGLEVPQRRARRYLDKFGAVWRLQSFLLSEADRHDVPIITNNDIEKAALQVILHVNQELARHFTGSPEQVFGLPQASGEENEQPSWQALIPLMSE